VILRFGEKMKICATRLRQGYGGQATISGMKSPSAGEFRPLK